MDATKRRSLLFNLQYFLIGFVLIQKGLDKIDHHYALIGSIILVMGLIILGYFIYLLRTKKPNHTLQLSAHLFEGIALLFTSYVFFKDGKTYLPYATLFSGVVFIVVFFVHLLRHKKHQNIQNN